MTTANNTSMPETVRVLMVNSDGVVIISNAPAATTYSRADLATRAHTEAQADIAERLAGALRQLYSEANAHTGYWQADYVDNALAAYEKQKGGAK